MIEKFVRPKFAKHTDSYEIHGKPWPINANYACVYRKRTMLSDWTEVTVEFFEELQDAAECYSELVSWARMEGNELELERYVYNLGPERFTGRSQPRVITH